MSLIDELKRRNVFRVSAAYLALGWVVTQVTATVTPAFHLPESALTLVTWVGVIGFPFVVVFSWVFELTPEGLKREHEVERTESITRLTARRLDYTTIGIVALGVLLFAFQQFSPRHSEPSLAATGAAPTVATPAAVPPTAPALVASDKSIAVLPFVNMSEDAKNEYFSDGISEELLNLLAKIPELKVTSRSSAFTFKGKDIEIPEIAKRLNVAHILEGSVRKAGNTVRITAQLIDTRSDTHLWSETYDRELTDIFAVQDEIAAAVVTQLKITLLGAAPTVKKTDPKAYALFLQAHQLNRQATVAGHAQAILLDQQALAIDPDYAAAWEDLAQAYGSQTAAGLRPIDEGLRLTRDAVNKALAIDPNFAQAHADLGSLAQAYDSDLVAAAKHIQHALALEPANPEIIAYAASLADTLGRIDQAIALKKYVLARDPVISGRHAGLALSYAIAGRLDDAIAEFRNANNLAPGRIGGQYQIGVVLLLKGDPAGALAAMQQDAADTWRRIGLPMAYHALGKKAESDAALAELIQQHEKEAAYNIAYVLAYRGEADRAFEWLDQAVAYKDPGLSEIVTEAFFANIQKDPRWLPFLRKLGKAPEQLAAIKFDVKLPQ